MKHTPMFSTSSMLPPFQSADYKPQILGPKIEEFPSLAHKFPVNYTNRSNIQNAAKNGVKIIQAVPYIGACTIHILPKTCRNRFLDVFSLFPLFTQIAYFPK